MKHCQSSRGGRRVMARRAIVGLCIVGLLAQTAPMALAQEEGTKVQVAELSPEAERAIENALKYLAKTQAPDGSWSREHKAGITSLALMAFMLKGHFPKQGLYGRGLDRAVQFLLAKAKAGGGYFGGNMYEHGLATLALSEVWGMCDQKEIRDTLKQRFAGELPLEYRELLEDYYEALSK
jgi:hypothetical protein